MIPAGITTDFLGHSDAANAIRAFDWMNNPLGPISQWSQSLRTLVAATLASAFPKCIVWGTQRIAIYNDAFVPILGQKHPALGRSFQEMWQEVWATIEPIAARAYAGTATFIEDFPLLVNRSGYTEQTYFTFCYSPIRDDDGRVAGFLDTVIETTSKVRAEKQAQLINRELAHRIQNTLQLVNTLADQTFRNSPSLDHARVSLSQRIRALGRAHAMLTESNNNSATITAVIEGTLAPHQGALGEICAQGPSITLSAQQALTLGMCVHELATNAAKYGSLSQAGGEVTIRWKTETIDGEDYFRFTWVESKGPPVAEPKRRGFGSMLIEHVFADDFRGKVQLRYEPSGLHCELAARMSDLQYG